MSHSKQNSFYHQKWWCLGNHAYELTSSYEWMRVWIWFEAELILLLTVDHNCLFCWYKTMVCHTNLIFLRLVQLVSNGWPSYFLNKAIIFKNLFNNHQLLQIQNFWSSSESVCFIIVTSFRNLCEKIQPPIWPNNVHS